MPPVLDPMVPSYWRVQQRRQETADTFTLALEPASGAEGCPFAAGQFNMLYLFGAGEIPISISGNPSQPARLEHTTRSVGAVTKAMSRLKRGQTLGVRGPFGNHWPTEEVVGDDVVIVAGGIGLAPLRPAIHQLLSQRERYGRIILLYGCRTPEDVLYRRQLEQWRSQLDLDVHVTVDHALPGWHGNVGVVTTLLPKAPFDPSKTAAFVCGPEVMMRFTVSGLLKRGVAVERIFISVERNMKCAVGFCGHCQLGPVFVCKEGPIFRYDKIQPFFVKREM